MNRREVIRTLAGSAIFTGIAVSTPSLTMADDSHPTADGQLGKTNAGAGAKNPITPPPLDIPPPPTVDVGTENTDDPVKAGQEPLDRDETKWKELVNTFYALYGPVPQRYGIKPPNTNGIQSVDQKSSVRNINYQSKLSERFLWNHVELLLNQSADLLERASQMRDQMKEKSAKLASLALEVADFFENDAIHKDEISSGIYTTPYLVSLADENAQLQRANGADAFMFYNDFTIKNYYSNSAINLASGRSQLLSWLSFLPNYQLPYVGDPLIQTFNGVGLKASDHAVAATADLSFRSAFIELYSLLSQSALQQSLSNSFKSYHSGAVSKRKWDAADIDFKRRRTQAARDIADEKVRLACIPGGAFNYAEQVESCCRRLVRDLIDAMSRLTAASQGLNVIYGYNSSIPKSAQGILNGTINQVDLPYLLDDLIDWVRNAIAYLVSFNQRDQGYAFTVSLKKELSGSAWSHGKETGEWKLSFKEDWLPKQLHVRTRGINIFTRGSEGLWRATISTPEASYYRQMDGSACQIDQSEMPPVRFGKIDKRVNERYQEIYGTTSMRNAAPFGEWIIRFDDRSTQNENRNSIDDIEVDFDLISRNQSK